MPRSAPDSQRLEVGPDVAAAVRPEELGRLHDLHDALRPRCPVCDAWLHRDSRDVATVSLIRTADGIEARFAHAACAPSRAELAALVAEAGAQPLGIQYSQALHPDAGAVLLWERTLTLFVRDGAAARYLYLDPERWEGFHFALADEPVRLLARWRLAADAGDLVLRHDERDVERFADALERSPPRWRDSLQDTGFCLLIVGAGIGLRRPGAPAIQRAIRECRALMGMVEYEL